jgi:hypothetical protein
MSACVLSVAVLGWTPVGESARNLVVPKGSVGTPQLRNGAVTTPKLRNGAVGTLKLKAGAVTSAKVQNGSLLAEDFKAGQLPGGQKGDKGDPGPAGPPGVSGREIVIAASLQNSANAKQAFAHCPGGRKVIGGGARLLPLVGLSGPVMSWNHPADDRWQARAYEVTPTANVWWIEAYAICANVP